VWSAMTRESLAHGRGCCAAMSQIPPWAHVVTGALRNLDSIDSHLGRLLQDAWHYEPPGSIGLDLFDASSACRGWCLFPGVALGLVSMTGTGRHRSAYSVPWGKHDLTATPCLFNPRQTWTRHLTLGGADKRAVWFVVRGRRHWSTIGQPSPSPPWLTFLDKFFPVGGQKMAENEGRRRPVVFSGYPPLPPSAHNHCLPRYRTRRYGSQSRVMDKTRGSWLKCNPPGATPPFHQRCDGISPTYLWTGRLRYPDWLSTVQAKENSAPIFGVGKGESGEAHLLGAEPALSPATEQTRDGVTWPRSTRPVAIAGGRWPHGRRLPPSSSWSPTTFGFARRAIPGGRSCRHQNAKCR
jgi:hypothetical protein